MSKGTCFTLMPFGDPFDQWWLAVIRPAVQAAGLEPLRADSVFAPGTIIGDIFRQISSSVVVIADLTDRNANVFYELGLAHALAKPTVLLAAAIEHVPFDLRAERVLTFDRDAPDWGAQLREELQTSLEEALSSPRDAVLPAFLAVSRDTPVTVSRLEKEILEIRHRLEVLASASTDLQGDADGPTRKRRTRRMKDPHEIDDEMKMLMAQGKADRDILQSLSGRHVSDNWLAMRLQTLRQLESG